MKAILVPTDFSECSVNALRYAMALAQLTKSKIILQHVYQIQVPVTDLPVLTYEDTETMEEGFTDLMQKIVDEQKAKHGWSAEVEIVNSIGITYEEINSAVDEYKIDLIIMGMHGKASAINKFLGSTSTLMINEAICPLLLIPESASFWVPDTIAIAFDTNSAQDLQRLGVAKHLFRLFNANILAFSVLKEQGDPAGLKVVSETIHQQLEGMKHSIHYNVNYSVEQGITHFTKEHGAKMLIMFHHTHNIFSRMFAAIHSAEISFAIDMPLMIINQKANVFPRIDL